MSKDVYYFSHDANAHQDVKIKAMISVYGAEGYGWYWILIELMRQQEEYRISMARKYDIPSLSSSLPNCDADKCREFINDCIKEFELFESDGQTFWSESLLKRMEKVDSMREKRRYAANVRHGNVKKKKKEEKPFDDLKISVDKPKEKKDEDPKKIKDKRVLKDDQLFYMFVDQLRANKDFQRIPLDYFRSERDKCLDWLDSKGEKKKDYKAFFRNWMRNNKDSAPTEQLNESKMPKGLVI